MKKRCISMILCLLMLFSIMPVSALAANTAGDVSLTIQEQNGKTSVNVGDRLTYTVTMDLDANSTLAAMEFTLVLPSQLKLISSETVTATDLGAVGLSWKDMHLAAYGMGYKQESTKLITVVCEAVSAGSSSLSVKNECFVTYGTGNELEYFNVTVSSPRLSVAGTGSSYEEDDNNDDSSSDGKLSSSEVKDAFESSKKNTVTLDVTEDTRVSKTLFTLLSQNEDKTAVLSGDGYSWSFKGSDISRNLGTAYFDSEVTSSTPKKNTIKKLIGSASMQNIRLAHEGVLPGQATLTVTVDKALRGKTLYCYYYNAATNSLELIAPNLKAKNGKVSIVIDKGQDYVLLDTLLSFADSGDKKNPETGAGWILG